jgi:peptidyl-prolyl cis-trans isomerase C
MKALSILVFACLAGQAQTAPQAAAPALPNLPDTEVIATFEDGVSMTFGEFRKFFDVLPPEAQQNALKDREGFMKGWAIMRKLKQMAEKDKLEDGSPTHESLEYDRMRILAQAAMVDADHHITVPPAEARQYYDAHREQYKEVRVKAIYLGFSEQAASSASGPKSRTEDQAKALAAKLRADLRGGADFVKLVAQYSEDAPSKAKDGDFATLHGSDNIPEEIRTVVMALKPGEVSEPIRQPSAIYIFRAEAVSYKPFEQVSDEIFTQLRRDHYVQWMEKINSNPGVEFKSPAFYGTAPADGKSPGGH